MKKITLTRRIDELGRIVIPKEIRNSLHIDKGELLEIYLEEGKIVLNKYNNLKELNSFIKQMMINLSKLIKRDLYLTNLEEVIYSNKKECIGKNLYSDYIYIKDLKINMDDLKNDTNKNDLLIRKVSANADLIGYLIVYAKENEIDNKLIEFIIVILQNYVEI